MLKKIIINIIISGAIILLGVVFHDFLRIRDIGQFIAGAGFIYGISSIGYVLYKQGLPHANKIIKKTINEREITKAHDDLLRYKKLLNEGILTEEEFTKKSQELKSKIL